MLRVDELSNIYTIHFVYYYLNLTYSEQLIYNSYISKIIYTPEAEVKKILLTIQDYFIKYNNITISINLTYKYLKTLNFISDENESTPLSIISTILDLIARWNNVTYFDRILDSKWFWRLCKQQNLVFILPCMHHLKWGKEHLSDYVK